MSCRAASWPRQSAAACIQPCENEPSIHRCRRRTGTAFPVSVVEADSPFWMSVTSTLQEMLGPSRRRRRRPHGPEPPGRSSRCLGQSATARRHMKAAGQAARPRLETPNHDARFTSGRSTPNCAQIMMRRSIGVHPGQARAVLPRFCTPRARVSIARNDRRDEADRDATILRSKPLLERQTRLLLELAVRRQEGDGPAGPILTDHVAELRVEVSEALRFTHPNPVRRIHGDQTWRADRRESGNRAYIEGHVGLNARALCVGSRSDNVRRRPGPRRQSRPAIVGARCSVRRQPASTTWLRPSPGHRTKANDRRIPGAIRRAIRAASMGIVPEPHIGSSNGVSPVHPAPSNTAAASVSRRGALANC